MRVLLIDDEQYYFKLIRKALKDANYELEYAKTGTEGLAKIPSYDPELLIVDLRLPDLPGLEILERLRRDSRFGHIPVIVITAKDELDEKLKAFELGADDYLVKPFQPEELVARMGILARRGKAMQIIQQMGTGQANTSTVITLHSLRGGVGCSSLAINLGLALYKLWGKQTLLVDAVLTAGQIALMLDASSLASWENLVGITSSNIDEELVKELASLHKSGVYYFASPKYPIASDTFSTDLLHLLIEKIRAQFEFVVIDTSHDFSDITIQMLNSADTILLIMAPEMASLRSAVSALEIYDRLEIPREKVRVALNNNSTNIVIKQAQLEKVLGMPIAFTFPYEAGEVARAINFGEPFMLSNPDLPLCLNLEKAAYALSNDVHKVIPPAVQSPTWKRVTSQLNNK